MRLKMGEGKKGKDGTEDEWSSEEGEMSMLHLPSDLRRLKLEIG